jgi:gamma-glutamylcyclotransferase (GGCT)/AIG2-like uncharacterized protein YtfP
MKHLLFIYGTLEDPAIQEKIFGKIIPSADDELLGYKRVQVNIGKKEYWKIAKEKYSSVKGKLIEVTADELKDADTYETGAFRRERLLLRSKKKAWVYM